MSEKRLKTDVLVIGGGMAGCFAAIKASEMGKNVALLDKATLRRGGCVGPGMDHVSVGVHPDATTLEEAKLRSSDKRKELYDPNVLLRIDVASYDRVQDLEAYGVPIREEDGRYWWLRVPERRSHLISYRGKDTKVKLGKAVEKTDTKIFERTMGIELLKDNGRVIGAIGLNTRTGELTTFLAKAIILATGEAGRQYIEPDGPFMTYYPVTNTGDSQAMAYRAGAKMINMEFVYNEYTLSRASGGIPGVRTFKNMGKLINRNGDVVMKKSEDCVKRGFLMTKEIMEGRSPLYFDLRNLPEDAIHWHERDMEHEWPIAIEWFKQRNLDFRKTPIPIQVIPACILGGPLVDETFQTSIPGLYSAGAANSFVMGLTPSSASGYIAGEEAANYSSTVDLPEISDESIEDIKKDINAPLNRQGGIDPKELEIAIRGVVTDYVGYFKTEGLMLKGLDKLLELKSNFSDKAAAWNPHELMRCCEVRNIFDMLEMHIRTSLYRTETRLRKFGLFVHYRVDYPYTDPNWEKLVVIQLDKNNNAVISTSEIPELKEA